MKHRLYAPQAIAELGKRSNQEDSIWPQLGEATTLDRLFVVCDGMGGHEHGEVASALACQTLARLLQPALADGSTPLADQAINQAFEAAYDQLDQHTPAESNRGMGTTVAMLAFHSGGCTAAHLGDSRIYHLRPQTGEVLYRSRDHSLVQQLFEVGEIGYHDMKMSPNRNVVTKALLPHRQRYMPELMHTTDLQAGDYFLICSDGMLEQMDDQQLMQLLADTTTDDDKRRQLIEMTAGNSDNHSAYLLHLEGIVAEAADAAMPNDEAEQRVVSKVLNDPDYAQLFVEAAPIVELVEEPQADGDAAPVDDESEASMSAPAPSMPETSARPGGSKWLTWALVAVALAAVAFAAWLMLRPKPTAKPVAKPIPAAKTDGGVRYVPASQVPAKRESRYKTFDSQPNTTAQPDRRSEEVDNILQEQKQRQADAAERKNKAVRDVFDDARGRNTPQEQAPAAPVQRASEEAPAEGQPATTPATTETD